MIIFIKILNHQLIFNKNLIYFCGIVTHCGFTVVGKFKLCRHTRNTNKNNENPFALFFVCLFISLAAPKWGLSLGDSLPSSQFPVPIPIPMTLIHFFHLGVLHSVCSRDHVFATLTETGILRILIMRFVGADGDCWAWAVQGTEGGGCWRSSDKFASMCVYRSGEMGAGWSTHTRGSGNVITIIEAHTLVST